MEKLEKFSYLILIACPASVIAVKYLTKDTIIRDTVSVIAFVIVCLTVIPLAIHNRKKNKKK